MAPHIHSFSSSQLLLYESAVDSFCTAPSILKQLGTYLLFAHGNDACKIKEPHEQGLGMKDAPLNFDAHLYHSPSLALYNDTLYVFRYLVLEKNLFFTRDLNDLRIVYWSGD